MEHINWLDHVELKKMRRKNIDLFVLINERYKINENDSKKKLNIFLLGGSTSWWHPTNGFPVKPTKQLHCGEWLITRHSALTAQTPGHGSLHLLFKQARWPGQSLFVTHSGRHPLYGSP